MAAPKRKRPSSAAVDVSDSDDAQSDSSSFSVVKADSDDEIDISSALTAKKHKPNPQADDASDGDLDDLQDLIRDSIAKRNVKGGTDVLKKTKGKTKFVKGEVGGGSFQSMGLHPSLLRSLTLQGYRIPTPIQRSSIPSLLASPPRDLVGMARTGSGKTLAYMIPLVQRLGGRHSTTFGARALILTPTRELALQVLRVGKELARGWSDEGAHAGDQTGSDSTKGQSLRWGMIVGGEGLDEQFEMITNNPDVIIATPGRLLHLIVEMNLDLRSVQYVVFDEADRLFEMGFETALNEIIHRLPASRQTLLFSATLPKSLVEFAKAGLQDPKLVRLDAESKISSDLKMAFFSVKQAEKDACLLALLRDVIHVPLGSEMPQDDKDDTSGGKFRKGKGKQRATQVTTAPHQTLIFAATKHHVEYLANLLSSAGYAVSHIYGALDQAARQFQMEQFRRGHTSLLVVTDVAARGIDIPVLENVVNYDFPHGARVFVHRVGRTARAGRQGWAWSFVTHTELPYLLDLQLFLGRPLSGEVPSDSGDEAYTESLIFGPFGREEIDEDVEYVRQLDEAYHQLPTLRDVMKRGHMMYERSKGKASQASYKRAKEMSKDHQWSLAGATEASVHPILVQRGWRSAKGSDVEQARSKLMQVVNSFTPSETVFEVGHKGKGTTVTSALMKERRKALQKAVERAVPSTSTAVVEDTSELVEKAKGISLDMADEDEIEAVFGTSKKGGKDNFRDEEFYMSHYQKDSATDKGYALTDGASFVEQARGATFDLTGDDGVAGRQRHQVKWDKKKKRFVKGDGVGADNVKMVKTESGVKLPATYRSGRFEEWKAKSKVSLPKIGEAEQDRRPGTGSRKFRHNKVTEAKPLDQLRSDYDRKVRQSKKAEEANDGPTKPTSKRGSTNGPKGAKGKTRHGGKPMGRVKNEIKTVDQIRKQRKATEQRKAKNARTTRKGRR